MKTFRIKQVVELLSLPKSTVCDLIRRGEISVVRVGSGRRPIILVPETAIAEFIQRNLVPANPRRRPLSRTDRDPHGGRGGSQ